MRARARGSRLCCIEAVVWWFCIILTYIIYINIDNKTAMKYSGNRLENVRGQLNGNNCYIVYCITVKEQTARQFFVDCTTVFCI